jgi:integrase
LSSFFWSGTSDPDGYARAWGKYLRRLFSLAKIKNGHAHRFRDTFAVELLQEGVGLEQVSVLLGHSSVRITERHYAPWVQSRQARLEAEVERVLRNDPVAFSQTKGTLEGHEGIDRPN